MKEQDSLRKRWRWPGEGGYTADSETNGLKLYVKGQLSGTADWLNMEGRNQQEFLAVSLSNDLYAAPFTEMEVEEEEELVERRWAERAEFGTWIRHPRKDIKQEVEYSNPEPELERKSREITLGIRSI